MRFLQMFWESCKHPDLWFSAYWLACDDTHASSLIMMNVGECFYKWLSAKCDLMSMQAGRKIPRRHDIGGWTSWWHHCVLEIIWRILTSWSNSRGIYKIKSLRITPPFKNVIFIDFMKRRDHFADLCQVHRPPPGDILLIFSYLGSCATWALGHVMHIKHNY